MTPHHVLVCAALVGMGVGTFTLVMPAHLLASKGVAHSPGAVVWVRQVGVIIFAQGLMAFLMRDQPDAPTLRAFFAGSAVVQFGLLPIEIVAWMRGR